MPGYEQLQKEINRIAEAGTKKYLSPNNSYFKNVQRLNRVIRQLTSVPGRSKTGKRKSYTMKMRRKRNYGQKSNLSRYSRSGGYLTTGIKKRQWRSRRRVKMQKWGVTKTFESGSVKKADEVMYLGHTTHPAIEMRKMMWKSVFKALFKKMGYDVTDPATELPGAVTNDTIYIDYIIKPGFVPQNVNVIRSVCAMSIEALGEYFGGLNTNFNNQENDTDFVAVRFQPGTNSLYPSTNIRLEKSIVKVYVKSSLKIQNRSVTKAADNEADDVDNVPLYGRGYQGTGTCPRLIKPYNSAVTSGIEFLPSHTTGVIYSGTVTEDFLKEPLFGNEWKNVKKMGKLHLDPGVIKTSVLTYYKTKYFNVMYSALKTDNGGLSVNTAPKVGKYRLFGIEKMIDAVESQPFAVAYEHDWYCGVSFATRKADLTVNLFEKSYVTPDVYP